MPTEIVSKVTDRVSATMNGANGTDHIKSYTVPALIGGKDIVLSQTFDVVAPATGKLLYPCSAVSVQDATKAVEAAHAAFKGWSESTPAMRRDIFLKAAEVLQKREAEFKQIVEEETGCDAFWATKGFTVTQDLLKATAAQISSLHGLVPTLQERGMRAMVWQEPYGVVLAIAPWNAPWVLGVRSIALPLAAGNTTILKASESAPKSFWAIADLFREAGLPNGVLNCIAHCPSDAAAITKSLIENPLVKKVNFTGSTGVGRVIGELAGWNLKPALLELGGKAPAIVWEDADLQKAARGCALGAFLHGGQICMSTERIIVHKNVVAEFEVVLKEALAKIFGPAAVLINKSAVEKNKRLLEDAVGKGAVLAYGSIDTKEGTETRMSPIILKGVTDKMDIYQIESFGPTVSIFVIETEEEALRIANDTEYGLSSSVFTEDLRRGFKFARGIESGGVHINSMTVHDESALPHGGVKSSGFGRFGAGSIQEWVRTKTVTYFD